MDLIGEELTTLENIDADEEGIFIVFSNEKGYYYFRPDEEDIAYIKRYFGNLITEYKITRIEYLIGKYFYTFLYSDDGKYCYFSVREICRKGGLKKIDVVEYSHAKNYEIVLIGKRMLLRVPRRECFKFLELREINKTLSKNKDTIRKDMSLLSKIEARFSDFFVKEDDNFCYFSARQIYRKTGWKRDDLEKKAKKISGMFVAENRKVYLAIPHDVCDPIKKNVEISKEEKRKK